MLQMTVLMQFSRGFEATALKLLLFHVCVFVRVCCGVFQVLRVT